MLALVALRGPALADQAPAAPPEASPPPATAAPPAKAAEDDFNFDLTPPTPTGAATSQVPKLALAPDPAAIERSVKLRRRMLTVHQGVGFATLGVMAATLVLGQLYWNDKYGGGDYTGDFNAPHLALSIGTTALYATTGLLALFAPNPYPKPVRFDTALVHKLSMILATVGMVAQVVLGPVAYYREGKLDQKPIALAHTITGYATFAFMAAGTVAYFF